MGKLLEWPFPHKLPCCALFFFFPSAEIQEDTATKRGLYRASQDEVMSLQLPCSCFVWLGLIHGWTLRLGSRCGGGTRAAHSLPLCGFLAPAPLLLRKMLHLFSESDGRASKELMSMCVTVKAPGGENALLRVSLST